MNALASYDDSAPLLLVTAFSPDHQGGGGVILRSLVKGSESSVVWASLEPGGAGYAGPTALLRAGRNPWLMPPRLMARRIESLAERHGASAIWAVAHGPIVPCVSVLGESSARSLHLSVHDEPAWGVAFRGRRQPRIGRDVRRLPGSTCISGVHWQAPHRWMPSAAGCEP